MGTEEKCASACDVEYGLQAPKNGKAMCLEGKYKQKLALSSQERMSDDLILMLEEEFCSKKTA